MEGAVNNDAGVACFRDRVCVCVCVCVCLSCAAFFPLFPFYFIFSFSLFPFSPPPLPAFFLFFSISLSLSSSFFSLSSSFFSLSLSLSLFYCFVYWFAASRAVTCTGHTHTHTHTHTHISFPLFSNLPEIGRRFIAFNPAIPNTVRSLGLSARWLLFRSGSRALAEQLPLVVFIRPFILTVYLRICLFGNWLRWTARLGLFSIQFLRSFLRIPQRRFAALSQRSVKFDLGWRTWGFSNQLFISVTFFLAGFKPASEQFQSSFRAVSE